MSASSATSLQDNADADMGDEAPETRFSTVKQLFEDIDSASASGDVLLVKGISVKQLAEVYTAREEQGRKFRFQLYNSRARKLVVTIPTRPHESLHGELWDETVTQIAQMGLKQGWARHGATTYKAAPNSGFPGQDGGEGDSGGGPRPERSAPGAWPTLVIESGVSSSLALLRTTMRWWFAASAHQVKIVILAKLNRNPREILLEKWIEQPMPPRPGATNTRNASQPALTPMRTQEILIAQDPSNPTSFIVTRGALQLEFALLLLRQPGYGEGDIVFDVNFLRDYASRVWEGAE